MTLHIETSYDFHSTFLNFIDNITITFVFIIYLVLISFILACLFFYHIYFRDNNDEYLNEESPPYVRIQKFFGEISAVLKSSKFACEKFDLTIKPDDDQGCPIDTNQSFISGVINIKLQQILLIKSIICLAAKKEAGRPKWLNHIEDPTVDLNVTYSKEKQKKRFPFPGICVPHYNRGHLHPKSASCYSEHTFSYHNVTPQLDIANSGAWVNVEKQMLHSLPERYKDSLETYTGIYENLLIDGKPYFLGADKDNNIVKKIPVARVIWKIIYSPKHKKGIVFILHNFPKALENENPVPFSEFSLSDEELGQMPGKWRTKDWNQGYCYAVTVENFLNNATWVIRQELEGLDVSNGLLTIKKGEKKNKNKNNKIEAKDDTNTIIDGINNISMDDR